MHLGVIKNYAYKTGWDRNNRSEKTSVKIAQSKYIAGRLPENSRNSFVDLQSQKDSKRNTKINISLNGEIL